MPTIPPKLASLLGVPERVTLHDGTPVLVRPFTIEEWDEMDHLEPDPMTGRAYMRLKLWMILRSMPGFETDYATWKQAFDGEALERLRPVAEAVEKVNGSFRPRAVSP